MNHDWSLLLVAPLPSLQTVSVARGFKAGGMSRGLQVTGRPGADLRPLVLASG